jgi:hypothetical protein
MKDLVIQLQAKIITLLEGTPGSIDELVSNTEALQNETVSVLHRQYQRLASPSRQLPNHSRTRNERMGSMYRSGYAAGHRDSVEYAEGYARGAAAGFAETMHAAQHGQIEVMANRRQLQDFQQPVGNAGFGVVGTLGAAAVGVVTIFPTMLYNSVFGPPRGQRRARLNASNRIRSATFIPDLISESDTDSESKVGTRKAKTQLNARKIEKSGGKTRQLRLSHFERATANNIRTHHPCSAPRGPPQSPSTSRIEDIIEADVEHTFKDGYWDNHSDDGQSGEDSDIGVLSDADSY